MFFSDVKNNPVDLYLKRKYVNSAVCGQNFHLSVINLATELNTWYWVLSTELNTWSLKTCQVSIGREKSKSGNLELIDFLVHFQRWKFEIKIKMNQNIYFKKKPNVRVSGEASCLIHQKTSEPLAFVRHRDLDLFILFEISRCLFKNISLGIFCNILILLEYFWLMRTLTWWG